MTPILSALLFSLSANLDNLVIGIAYGIKKIKIKIIANFIIATITSLGTLFSMLVGAYISRFISHYIANYLGAIVIIILGAYYVIQSIKKISIYYKPKDLALKDISEMIEYAELSDSDKSGDISIKEATIIALGLTFNNLGTGIAASITGVNIQFTVISTFALSILTIIIGEIVGNHFLGKFLGKYASLFSGILLIILGIIEFFN